MKGKVKYFLAVMLAVILGFSVNVEGVSAADGDGTVNAKVRVQYGQSEARSMLNMINDFRTGNDAWAWNEDNTEKKKYDSAPLVYDYDLEKAAMLRAAEIAVSYSHTRPNGQTCFTAYTGNHRGENIAAGYRTASAVFQAWQETNEKYNGQGHRRNMLNNFQAVGIGHVYYNGYHYWVQEFRSPAGSTSATAANDSETLVELELLKSAITNVSLTPSVKSLTLSGGKTADLPKLTISIRMSGSWPSNSEKQVELPYSWSVADEGYASVTGGKIVGKKAGSTELTATVLGKTITIPVTVKADAGDNSDPGNDPGGDGNGNDGSGDGGSGDTGNGNDGDGGNGTGDQKPDDPVSGPKKDSIYTVSNVKYKITSAEAGRYTAAVSGPSKKTLKSAAVPATITVDGTVVKVTEILPNAFKECKKLNSVSIGKNVTRIGSQAFYGCTSLTAVKGCSGIESIKSKAFYKCAKLVTVGSRNKTITLSKVKTIDSSAFYGCKAIKKVNLTSAALTELGSSSFSGCTSMTSFTAKSKKLSSIGKKVFYGDKRLAVIVLKTEKLTKAKVGDNAFKGIKSTCRITVPAKKVAAYKKIFRAKGAGSKVRVTK
ncbi:MAG: leucine-rich repeat protein [Lachnospiraceae bacterium]